MIAHAPQLFEALQATTDKLDEIASKLSMLRDNLPLESPLMNLTAFDYQTESDQARSVLATVQGKGEM